MADLGGTLKLEADPAVIAALKKTRSGWYSTKLHLALIAIAVLTVVFVFVVARTGSSAGWGEYCITVATLVASTQGSRVAESFAQRPPPTH